MIFVTVGAQDFPFDRLLASIDGLIEKGIINDNVIAQAGSSHYKPKHYAYWDYLTFDVFDRYLSECSLLITHGGTGSIVSGLKKGKTVIAVPRQKKYHEAVDDHQAEIIGIFADNDMVIRVQEMEDLEEAINKSNSFCPRQFISGRDTIIKLIGEFISSG